MINKLINKLSAKKAENFSANFEKKSFAQCGEDMIVDYIFRLRHISNPSFIDIGANHPYYLNNTAFLYEKGIRGINIDANPVLIKEFNIQRSEDKNINIGVGPSDEELDFFIINDPTLSTFSKEEADNIIASGKYFIEKTMKIKLTTVEKILDEHFNGLFPDFLSLDVEGLDFEIITSIKFEKHWPKVICVEAAEYSPRGDGARKDELIKYIISKGYIEYANTNLNSILIKKEFWYS